MKYTLIYNSVFHRIKDDRMENSINGSRYMHNLLWRGGWARRYTLAPPTPHSPPSPTPLSCLLHKLPSAKTIFCCTAMLLWDEADIWWMPCRAGHKAGSICIKNLKLKNIQFVVNSFYPKNGKAFKNIFLAQLACEFAWICEYLESFLYPTLLKICREKFDRK